MKSSSPKGVARLDIEVAAVGLAPANRASVQKALQQCAVQLVHDLDLASDPRVTVAPADGDDALRDGPGRRMRIGGVTARVRWWLPGDRTDVAASDPVALARQLCEDLIGNRELLVTAETMKHAAIGSPPGLSSDGVMALLRECVALGTRVSRLDGSAADAGTMAAVDRAHDAALAVSVQVSEDDYAELPFADPPEPWREVLGVPVPVTVATDGGLARNDFRVRVNDLSFPVRRAAQWADTFGRVTSESMPPLVAAVQRQLEEIAPLLAGGDTIQLLVDMLRRSHPRLVDESRKRVAPTDFVRAIRYLLAERVPVNDLRGITESMLTTHGRAGTQDVEHIVWDPHSGTMLTEFGAPDESLTAGEFAEIARIAQDRRLLDQIAPQQDSLAVTLFSGGTEAAIVGADGPELRALAPRLVSAVGHSLREATGGERHPHVLLCSGASRRRVREALRVEFPEVYVVSYRELPSDMGVTVASRVTLR